MPVVTTTITDTLLVIGTALEGPVNTPVRLSTLDAAVTTFGPMVFRDEYINPATGSADGARAGNDLVEAIERAMVAGCNDIIAVRVPGEQATANITEFSSGTNLLQIQALFHGNQYNGIVLTLTYDDPSPNHTWQLTQPASRGGILSGTLAAAATIGDLVNAVNNHPDNSTVRLVVHPSQTNPAAVLAQPLTDILDTGASGNQRTFTTSGGLYGTRSQRFNAADGYKSILDLLTAPSTGTFAMLQETEADVVFLSCLYADDRVDVAPTETVIPFFANFVHEMSKNRAAHGVIDARPYVAPDSVTLASYYQTAYLDTASGVADATTGRVKIGFILNNHPWMVKEVDGDKVDFGRYISIVIGMPAQFRSWQVGEYVANIGASLAGMLTVMSPAEIAAFRTPRGVVDVVGARIPRATFESLMAGVGGSGGGYVVFRPSLVPGGSPVIANDVTAAQASSVFHYQSNARIANIASKYLRQALVPFLGKPGTQDTLAAMSTAVRNVLNRLVELGALLGAEGIGYRFSLEPIVAGLQTVTVRCLVELRPTSYVRAITVDVTVTL